MTIISHAPKLLSPPLRPDVAVLVALGAVIGWSGLVAGLAVMLANTDTAMLGPGMDAFNGLTPLADLPDAVRASLAALCLTSPAQHVSLADALAVFAMWSAMVLAMMLPSAAPVLSIGSTAATTVRLAPLLLATGYLTSWTGFSVLATGLQLALAEARIIRSAMAPMTDVLAGTTILLAGLYQVTPWKAACLARCRNPAPLFTSQFPTTLGLFREGLIRGVDCLGCCAMLMLVMFAVGTMNVVWMAGLAAVMTLEKLASGPWPSRFIGLGLLVIGAGIITASPVGAGLLARL